MNQQDNSSSKQKGASRQKSGQTENTLLEVVNAIPGTLFIFQFTGDRIGAMPYVSDGLQRLTGIHPDQVRTDVAPLLARIHPWDIEPFFASAQESTKDMVPWQVEFRVERPDGNEVWIEWQATPVRQEGTVLWHGMLLDITDRKNLQQRLELLEASVNQSSDAVFLINEDLRFEYVNDTACQRLGYTQKELSGMQPSDIDPDIDLNTASAMMQRTLVGETVSFETRHQTKGGRLIPVEINAILVEFSGRRFSLSIARDISERKKVEQAFRNLGESSPDYIIRFDRENRIRYLNDKLARKLELASTDEVIGRRPSEIWPNARYSAIEQSAIQAVERGETIGFDFSEIEVDGSTGYQHIQVVPERDDRERIIGTLAFGRDVTALRENERRLQFFVENLPGMAFTFRLSPDGQGSFPYISPRAKEFYGIAPEELQGDMAILHGYTHPEDQPRLEAAIAEAAQNVSPIYTECRICPPGMPQRWLVIRSAPEQLADGSILWSGIMLDISEKMETVERLRRSEREFRTLADNMPDNVVRWDAQGHYLYLNPAHERTLKARAKDLIGKSVYESNRHLVPEVREGISRVVYSGIPELLQRVPVVYGPDNTRFYDVKLVPEFDDGGDLISVLALGRDMTDLYGLQEAVTTSEQAFRSLAENLPDLVVRYDDKCRRTFVNPYYKRFTGVDGQDALGKTPQERWMMPSGRDEATGFQAHLQQVLDSGRPQEWEFNTPNCNGKTSIVEFHAAPEFAPDGRTKGVLIVGRDITTRRAMEQQLRTAASVFDAAREGIVITDPRGRIYDTNPAFSTITGYARDNVLGQRPYMLAREQQDLGFYREMRRRLRGEGTWSGELVSQRKNGERYFLQMNVMAMHDTDGRANYYIAIFSDITALKLHEQQLQHIAYHDALTGLPNRHSLSEHLSRGISAARQSGKMLAVLYLDLDGFKPINDNFGHEMGDRVLVEVAHRITDGLRDSDTVARLGGDEFVALLVDINDLRECELAARRLLDGITQPIVLDGQRLNLSASIGISRYPNDGSSDADILLRYADQAMYLAKAAGRNQLFFYGDDPRSQALGDTQIIHDLRLALDQEQITVHYQPIIDMATGQIIKAEALARWQHPQKGMVPPSEFIPAAENGGLIQLIGDQVFQQSVRVADTWNQRKGKSVGTPLRVSVNLSPRQFFHRDGVSNWVRHLEQQQVSGDLVTVELTEGLLLEDRPEVLEQLNQLREMGMTLSLDDFGTGYSALSYLKKFDIDYLKIDRSFIRDITQDPSDRAIVEAIIVMAKRLDIKLVAEGVETREQAAMLSAAECDMAQGFWYAKPMPEAEFLDFVEQFPGLRA